METNTIANNANIRTQLQSILVVNSSNLKDEMIFQEITSLFNTKEFGTARDKIGNAIIHLYDQKIILNMHSNMNFLPGFTKKLIGVKDRRPIIVAKGLDHETVYIILKSLY